MSIFETVSLTLFWVIVAVAIVAGAIGLFFYMQTRNGQNPFL